MQSYTIWSSQDSICKKQLKKASFPGKICAQKLSEIGSGDIELAHEFHFEIQERKIDRVEGNIKPWQGISPTHETSPIRQVHFFE